MSTKEAGFRRIYTKFAYWFLVIAGVLIVGYVWLRTSVRWFPAVQQECSLTEIREYHERSGIHYKGVYDCYLPGQLVQVRSFKVYRTPEDVPLSTVVCARNILGHTYTLPDDVRTATLVAEDLLLTFFVFGLAYVYFGDVHKKEE